MLSSDTCLAVIVEGSVQQVSEKLLALESFNHSYDPLRRTVVYNAQSKSTSNLWVRESRLFL